MKTITESSAAEFNTTKLRAGEDTRRRKNFLGKIGSSAAKPSNASASASRVERAGPAGRQRVETSPARIIHGSTSRPNLWGRKWNLMRLEEVNSFGSRAQVCQAPARVRSLRRNSPPST